MPNSFKLEALLFDLDGTLADTVVQLAKASKQAVETIGLNPPLLEQVKDYVGNGVNMLLARCIKGSFDAKVEDIDTTLFKRAREVFNEKYTKGLSENYRLYDGVTNGLELFKSKNLKLAVVTNKPHMFAIPLLKHMGIYDKFDFILAGEVLSKRKPDPYPLEYTLEKLNIKKENALMIGDSNNDILAGQRAGVKTAFLSYGYNRLDEKELHFDYRFDNFNDLTDFIIKQIG